MTVNKITKDDVKDIFGYSSKMIDGYVARYIMGWEHVPNDADFESLFFGLYKRGRLITTPYEFDPSTNIDTAIRVANKMNVLYKIMYSNYDDLYWICFGEENKSTLGCDRLARGICLCALHFVSGVYNKHEIM